MTPESKTKLAEKLGFRLYKVDDVAWPQMIAETGETRLATKQEIALWNLCLELSERQRWIPVEEKMPDFSHIELEKKYGIFPYDKAIAALTEMAHSERELCVLELTALALANTEHSRIIMDAAKLLREGGQKC